MAAPSSSFPIPSSLWRRPVFQRIRRACRENETAFVGTLAGKVLSCFGDYARLLPEWMQREDIDTYVVLSGCSNLEGFSMLGSGLDSRARPYADLLAIAVSPERHGRGTGRALLRHAIRTATKGYAELRLSVAEGNARARGLFESEGFRYVDQELGTYCQGQLALRMAKPLHYAMF